MKHEFQTFHYDVRTRVSVTDVSYEGYDVVCGRNVNNRAMCGTG